MSATSPCSPFQHSEEATAPGGIQKRPSRNELRPRERATGGNSSSPCWSASTRPGVATRQTFAKGCSVRRRTAGVLGEPAPRTRASASRSSTETFEVGCCRGPWRCPGRRGGASRSLSGRVSGMRTLSARLAGSVLIARIGEELVGGIPDGSEADRAGVELVAGDRDRLTAPVAHGHPSPARRQDSEGLGLAVELQ
jgi:hypothetical protein